MTEEQRGAIFRRVSDIKQGGEGQDLLGGWAANRDVSVKCTWSIQDSAWVPRSGKGREFDEARAAMLEAARMGKFKVLIIWALDRLSRRGIRDTLAVLEKLREYGVEVWSKEEPWLQVQKDETWELLVAFIAWRAKQESDRKSSRMVDSIAGRKADPTRRVGRTKGAKDKKPRKKAGYYAAWEEGGKRREAGGLERPRGEDGRFQETG